MKKKERIMEAAKRSFSMFGYRGTTVNQIAKIAGVGKGTIYTYFENKEVILLEIIQSFIQEMKEVAENSIQPEQSIFENLHDVLCSVLLYRNESTLMIKLSQEVNEFGTVQAVNALKQFEKEVLAYIQTLLERAMQKNKIKNCDPEVTAFIMFKLYAALTVDWNKDHEPLTNEKVYELFKFYLMDGITIR